MIAPDAAWDIVLQHVHPLKPNVVPLPNALGCCLAEEVRADRDLPPVDRSAMDGYAIRHADLLRKPCILHVIGEVTAGSPDRPRVGPGTCARISTGANIPPGADTVVIVEQAEEHDGVVKIRSSVARGANILCRGEDADKGEVLLAVGTVMGGPQIGVCATTGKLTVKVRPLPQATVLCTGSELRSTANGVRPHEVRNSCGPALCASLAHWGFAGTRYRVVPDRQTAILAALRRVLTQFELVLLTGGISVGKYDLVRDAVKAAGATIWFHGLAMKPGKPALYATVSGNHHIFALPGNPLAALAAFHELALPALRRLSGYPAEACRPAWLLPLAESARSNGGRVRCQLARLVTQQNGLAVLPIASRSSSDLASAGRADGAILLSPDRTRFSAGQLVTFRPWKPLP